MAQYLVSLKLDYRLANLSEAEYLHPVYRRCWPLSSEAQWASILVTAANETALAAELNTLIKQQLQIVSPYPDKTSWTIVQDPLQAAQWRVGAGGLHQARGTIVYDDGTGSQTWNYEYKLPDNTVRNTEAIVVATWRPWMTWP